MSTDAVLVAAALGGDRASFGRLHELYLPLVHGILLARVPHREVGDLLQDVFLVALRSLPTLADAAAFGPWIATIARNRAVDYHRRKRPTAELPEDLPGPAPAPETGAAAEVLAAIRSLPDAYRETLVLRLVEGLTGPEIAARTGLTPGSVRVNLHRGMERLRRSLAKEARP
jgi:RNA polymerase sigma-70 factor (ECF subfamily)